MRSTERRIELQKEMRTVEGWYAFDKYVTEKGLTVDQIMPKGDEETVRRKLIRKDCSDDSCVSMYYKYDRGENHMRKYDKKSSKANYDASDSKQSCCYFCRNKEYSDEYEATKAKEQAALDRLRNKLDRFEYASTKKQADEIHARGGLVYKDLTKLYSKYNEKCDIHYKRIHQAFIKMIIKDTLDKKHKVEAAA